MMPPRTFVGLGLLLGGLGWVGGRQALGEPRGRLEAPIHATRNVPGPSGPKALPSKERLVNLLLGKEAGSIVRQETYIQIQDRLVASERAFQSFRPRNAREARVLALLIRKDQRTIDFIQRELDPAKLRLLNQERRIAAYLQRLSKLHTTNPRAAAQLAQYLRQATLEFNSLALEVQKILNRPRPTITPFIPG